MEHSICSEDTTVWDGDTIHVKPTAETIIALAQIEVTVVQIGRA